MCSVKDELCDVQHAAGTFWNPACCRGPAAGATLFQAFDLNNETYQLHSAGDFAAAAPLFQRALDIKLQVGVVDCGPFSRSGDYKW